MAGRGHDRRLTFNLNMSRRASGEGNKGRKERRKEGEKGQHLAKRRRSQRQARGSHRPNIESCNKTDLKRKLEIHEAEREVRSK